MNLSLVRGYQTFTGVCDKFEIDGDQDAGKLRPVNKASHKTAHFIEAGYNGNNVWGCEFADNGAKNIGVNMHFRQHEEMRGNK